MSTIPPVLLAGKSITRTTPFARESDRWFFKQACDRFAAQFVDRQGVWHALLYLDEPVQVISISPAYSCLVGGAVVSQCPKDGRVGVWMCHTHADADFCWKCMTEPEEDETDPVDMRIDDAGDENDDVLRITEAYLE